MSETKEYFVEGTVDIHYWVTASSPEEAKRLAKSGDYDDFECDHDRAQNLSVVEAA